MKSLVLGELPEKVKPLKWLIPDILVQNDLTMLAASGATGKTTLTCYFIDKLIGERGSKVAYMSFEDDADALKRKLVGLDRYPYHPFWTLNYIDDVTGARTVLNIMDDEEYAYLKETLETNHIKFLVIDPISALLDGDINDNMAVRNLIERITALAKASRVSILGIHHLNKAGYGSINKAAVMGAAAWTDVPRHNLMLTKNDDTDERYLTVGKTNCDPEEDCWKVYSEKNEHGTYVVTGLETYDKKTLTQGDDIPLVIRRLKDKFNIWQSFNIDNVIECGSKTEFYEWLKENPDNIRVSATKKDGKKTWIFI